MAVKLSVCWVTDVDWLLMSLYNSQPLSVLYRLYVPSHPLFVPPREQRVILTLPLLRKCTYTSNLMSVTVISRTYFNKRFHVFLLVVALFLRTRTTRSTASWIFVYRPEILYVNTRWWSTHPLGKDQISRFDYAVMYGKKKDRKMWRQNVT